MYELVVRPIFLETAPSQTAYCCTANYVPSLLEEPILCDLSFWILEPNCQAE